MQGAEGPVLITGGAGFLGSILVRTLLGRGERVRVFDNLSFGPDSVRGFLSHPDYEFIYGSVLDRDNVRHALDGVSAVVHLAALVGDPLCASKPSEATAVNIEGTERIVEGAMAARIERFVFASTCSNYGITDTSVAADETRPLNPVSLYAETKVRSEQFILDSADGRLCPVLLRFATAYGISSRPRSDLLVNSLVKDALKDGMITIYGPQSWRPYAHANDIAQAIIISLDAPRANVDKQVFNVVVENFTKAELARKISVRLTVPVEFSPTKIDLRNYRVNGEKFAKTVGFRGTRSVDNSLEEIILAGKIGAL